MSYENFPTASPSTPEKKTSTKSRSNPNLLKNLVIAGLLVAMLGTWGYIIYDKNQVKEEKQTLVTQMDNTNAAKTELQNELNDATMQLDALTSTNAKNETLLKEKYSEIEALKTKVQGILNNKNATAGQLADAKKMINQLKGTIQSYAAEIEKLTQQNTTLTEEKRVVTEERDVVRKHFDSAKVVIKAKEDIIDIGSTLHASNLNIQGVKEKSSGKEKETTTAKRIDKLKISFEIDENLITKEGPKDIYITVTAPDGTPVAVEALGSGKFTMRDGVEKFYTKKVQVDYKPGAPQQVNMEWKQNSSFQEGNYKIEIYNNGFKIGEGVREFKKGGLFG